MNLFATQRGWKVGWDERETETGIYATMQKKRRTNENLPGGAHRELYSMLCGDLNRKEIQKRDSTCIHVTDSLDTQKKLAQHCKATIRQ